MTHNNDRYLHTDYVHSQVKQLVGPSLARFKSVPLSGFFLNHPNVVGNEVRDDES